MGGEGEMSAPDESSIAQDFRNVNDFILLLSGA